MGAGDIRHVVAVADPVAVAAAAAKVLARTAANRVRWIGKTVWPVDREAIAENYGGR